MNNSTFFQKKTLPMFINLTETDITIYTIILLSYCLEIFPKKMFQKLFCLKKYLADPEHAYLCHKFTEIPVPNPLAFEHNTCEECQWLISTFNPHSQSCRQI